MTVCILCRVSRWRGRSGKAYTQSEAPLNLPLPFNRGASRGANHSANHNDNHNANVGRRYQEADSPFLSQRRAYSREIESRLPHQPIVSCDAVGKAENSPLHVAHLAREEGLSCRLYDYWPLSDYEFARGVVGNRK